ncbi:hypothetical protein SAMN05414139_02083 [Burkholderia sp. D7]|nr:hypothetical protein SAMN05414139_02083 [Burkholderia sp. D7]
MLRQGVLSMLKAGCLAIYGLALAGMAGLLPHLLAWTMEIVAAAFLGIHALELVFVFGKVRLYRGPLAASVLLTLLFGLLHWIPLANAQAQKSRAVRV